MEQAAVQHRNRFSGRVPLRGHLPQQARNIRQTLPDLAGAPKPVKPGPGRPPGSKNRRPATRHDVGKTVTKDQPKKKTRRHKG